MLVRTLNEISCRSYNPIVHIVTAYVHYCAGNCWFVHWKSVVGSYNWVVHICNTICKLVLLGKGLLGKMAHEV